MRRRHLFVALLLALLPIAFGGGRTFAQSPGAPQPRDPHNEFPIDGGFHDFTFVHHPLVLHVHSYDANNTPQLTRQSAPAASSLTPAQIGHAYGFDAAALAGADGTGQVIGIVDAYDDPNALTDLNTFNTQFNLPQMTQTSTLTTCTTHPCFEKLYAQGSKPSTDAGWALETSLDIEWAHAVAPKADILLVEAASSSFTNLVSGGLVCCPFKTAAGAVDAAVGNGANVVSMSWGAPDFSGENSYDSYFNKAGVSFVASSGDSGNSKGTGALYPSTSPYVLAVGGTTLSLNADTSYKSETAWSGSGGGIGSHESQPGYQAPLVPANLEALLTSGKSKYRGSPDVAYDADPNSGVAVYDSTAYSGQSGWWQVGGTSAGSPQWAGLIALTNQLRGSKLSTNSLSSSPFYAAATGATTYSTNFNDVTSGSNGTPATRNGTCGTNGNAAAALCTAATGYDLVTGLGSPKAGTLIPYLATH